jgi:hypothetical protein
MKRRRRRRREKKRVKLKEEHLGFIFICVDCNHEALPRFGATQSLPLRHTALREPKSKTITTFAPSYNFKLSRNLPVRILEWLVVPKPSTGILLLTSGQPYSRIRYKNPTFRVPINRIPRACINKRVKKLFELHHSIF